MHGDLVVGAYASENYEMPFCGKVSGSQNRDYWVSGSEVLGNQIPVGGQLFCFQAKRARSAGHE